MRYIYQHTVDCVVCPCKCCASESLMSEFAKFYVLVIKVSIN